MSAIAKQHIASDAELWRVAESGDVDELRRVFSGGAHVNARNAHGMTALMKAACHGHALMVRALLERGADPNLARNDKFTALALAAFFGHTEVVKLLVEHGARTEVVTRCGASAQTWATRRTFVEAARCLEPHAPKPAPAAVPAPATAHAPVIKTLKDPPEIWDLVHEVPRGFDARTAFIARLKSMRATPAFRIAAVLIVSSACVVGVLVLRGSQARSLPAPAPANVSVTATEVAAPVAVKKSETETPVDPSAREANKLGHHSESSSVVDKPSRKVVLTRQSRARSIPEAEPVEVVQSREAPVAAPVIASPQVEPRKSPTRSDTALSPQLITPAKSASPKGKVIQWP